MTDNSYQKEIDHLALGLTRTPTFMGINVRWFFANLVINSLICIDAHTWLGIPLFVILHFIFLRLTNKDPNYLYLQAKSLTKTPPILNRWYWGKTNSYEPW